MSRLDRIELGECLLGGGHRTGDLGAFGVVDGQILCDELGVSEGGDGGRDEGGAAECFVVHVWISLAGIGVAYLYAEHTERFQALSTESGCLPTLNRVIWGFNSGLRLKFDPLSGGLASGAGEGGL